jgi:site-specific DNA recombinase
MKHTAAATRAAPLRRCAIYTRKSTAEGLDQAFNSLEAQREACEAYVRSQAGAGWQVIRAAYDDGGFTGANLDRPAFARLLADIEAGQVDVVVVYKTDRVSRSLLDFAMVMKRLNEAGVSFVSVTQNFSTTDAVGRMTLNLLATFAEFEREMIAERTRDKMVAARRRGMWTGGPVPLGYVIKDKKLVVEELEAVTVREVFRLYLEQRSALAVVRC